MPAVLVGLGAIGCGGGAFSSTPSDASTGDAPWGVTTSPDASPGDAHPSPSSTPQSCTVPSAACDLGGTTTCVNLQTDNQHCGTCTTACASGQICSAGACAIACSGATPTRCGAGASAYCADTNTDVANCGGCGKACASGASCLASVCTCPISQPGCPGVLGAQAACVPATQCLGGQLPTDCAQLRLLAPSLPSAAYTIDPDGAAGPIAPFAVYCDMVADGGGWTLALKANGTSTEPNPARFAYASGVWTTADPTDPNYVFNTASPDVATQVSAKYMSFNTLPYTQVRLGMTPASTPGINYVQFSLPGLSAYGDGVTGAVTQRSLRATFSSNETVMAGQAGIPAQVGLGAGTYTQQYGPPAAAGTPTVAEWSSLAPLSGPDCNFGGMNVDPGLPGPPAIRTRIGVLGSESGDCTVPNSVVGLGNDQFNCGAITPVGSAACASTLGNFSLSTFAYLYVRNSDFRAIVSPLRSCAAHLAAGHYISGIYPIAYGSVHGAVYCDMTHDGGGWTMVYKFPSGAPPTTDADVVWQGHPQNDSVPAQLNVMSTTYAPVGPYLSRIVAGDWNLGGGFPVTRARVVAYDGEDEGASLEFTDPGDTAPGPMAWFGAPNMVASTWTDLTVSGTHNFFSIDGAFTPGVPGGRRWYVNHNFGGCTNDTGWLDVTAGTTALSCDWERQWSTLPPISSNSAAAALVLYANQSTAVPWQTIPGGTALASALVVYVK